MIDSKAGIIGLVVGDAMGVPLEFCIREKLMQNPTTEMLGYGSHNVPKGSWSDDSSMTIATVDSIIKNKDIVYDDIANNFLLWMKEAKYTPTDRVFDIGRTCLRAITRFESKEQIAQECGGNQELDNGNGSLMRILPLVYYCYSKNMSEKEIYEVVKNVSSITHRHEISILGCYIYVLYGIELLKGKNLEQAYKIIKKIEFQKYFSEDSIKRYDRILKNNIKEYQLDEIKSTGFVVDTLEATLWILLNTNSYNQAIIGAINLGNDTDTIGACVGGLAGIYYGYEKIDKSWISDIIRIDYLIDICNKFNEVLNHYEHFYEEKESNNNKNNILDKEFIFEDADKIYERVKKLPFIKTQKTEWSKPEQIEKDVITMPFPKYNEEVKEWINKFYELKLIDKNYLKNYDIIKDKSIEDLSIEEILTYLTYYIRGERFCEGLIAINLENGTIEKLVKMLISKNINFTEIEDSNLKDIKANEIMFFTVAEGGAMGEPGGIEIITKNNNKVELYHTNYIYSINIEKLYPIINTLKTIHFSIENVTGIEKGFIHFFTGFGNHLFVNEILKDEFTKKIGNKYQYQIYSNWLRIALDLLNFDWNKLK